LLILVRLNTVAVLEETKDVALIMEEEEVVGIMVTTMVVGIMETIMVATIITSLEHVHLTMEEGREVLFPRMLMEADTLEEEDGIMEGVGIMQDQDPAIILVTIMDGIMEEMVDTEEDALEIVSVQVH